MLAVMAETSPITVDEVDAAIRRVLSGAQSVTLRNGTSYSQANLRELQDLRAVVAANEAQRARGGMFRRLAFGRPQ